MEPCAKSCKNSVITILNSAPWLVSGKNKFTKRYDMKELSKVTMVEINKVKYT